MTIFLRLSVLLLLLLAVPAAEAKTYVFTNGDHCFFWTRETAPPETEIPDLLLPARESREDVVLTRLETYTATIPHDTTRCLDHSLTAGTEQVLVEGRDGELLCTARVTYCNGLEIRREVLEERQTIAPVLSFSWRYLVSLATLVLAETKATISTATMVPTGS